MPVLEPPTDDLTRRVTSDELSPDSYDLENIINPLGEEPLFAGEGHAPGLQQNPANGGTEAEKQDKSFRQEYKERKQAKKDGTQLPPKELPKTKNQQAISAHDQQVINQIEELVKNKKYMAALAMIAGNPHVREIMRNKVSEIRSQMALNAAKDRIKMLATNAIRTAIMDLLIATSPWWEIILVVVLCIIAIVIGIAIMANRTVDNPPSSVPLGITDGNETGIYLSSSIMTPSMKISNASGKLNARTAEIHLEATAGGWSPEEAVDNIGGNWCIPGKGCLSPLSTLLPSGTTEEDMENYVTARFPYVYGFDFDYRGILSGAPRQGWGELKDYAGKKIILFNPKTKKAVVGIAAEFGPAPWTGVCSDRDSDTNNSVNKRVVTSCKDQRIAWNARDVVAGPKTIKLSKDQRAYDISPPPGYSGRIAGGEPKLREKIGIQADEVVIIGFAADQSLKPGTILTIKDSDIVTVGGTGTPTVAVPGVLPVPAVSEGQKSDCGDASGVMTALYYATSKGTKELTYDQLPASIKAQVEVVPADQQAEGGKFKTKSNNGAGVCLSPAFINNIPGSGGDWDFVSKANSAKDFEKAVTSIKNGDPVVMYTRPGGFYSKSQHVYVLVGYDETTKEFIVNNPSCRGTTQTSSVCTPPLVQPGIKGGSVGAPRQSFEHLFNYQGNEIYGHSMIIRKKWWQ
ncbi:hypothetical protein BH11PAT4_BH11PAT4_5930 [soil metagenome]